MSVDIFQKRVERIVGDLPEKSFIQIDNGQWVVAPNLYSKNGLLVDGKVLAASSYGGIDCTPIAVGYGLDDEQVSDVLSKCSVFCEEIENCMKEDEKEEAVELCKVLIKDICVVLTSVKNAKDETVSDIVRKLPEKERKKYYKIMKCLDSVPGFNANIYLQHCCHKMSISNGKFSGAHLVKNQEKLLEDMRSSYVPFMGESTLEQDHWGMEKVDDDSLMGDSDTYEAKKEVISYSPIHSDGIETVSERIGLDLKNGEPISDPLKKKKAFSKAVSVMEALGRIDDPRLEDAFGKLWSRLNLEKGSINWDKIIAVKPSENPVIVPVIFQSEDVSFPTEYSPIQALNVMDALTDITDYVSGSQNLQVDKNFDFDSLYGDDEEEVNSGEKFPFGASAPFSPPRRVKKEVV